MYSVMKDKIRKRVALLKAFEREQLENSRKTKDRVELQALDVTLSGIRGQQEAYTWMIHQLEEAAP